MSDTDRTSKPGTEPPETVRALLAEKGDAVTTIAPDAPLHEAARIMAEQRIGVLVCGARPDEVEGVISERDIVRVFGNRPRDPDALTVSHAMTTNVSTCDIDDEIATALGIMKRGHFRHLPVSENGKLVGLISVTDVLMHYSRHAAMPDRKTVVNLIMESGMVYPGG